MSDVGQAQQDVALSGGDARRSLWRRWFASTGTPPARGLVRYMVCGLVVGAALGGALPDFRGTLLAALTGAVVAASGSGAHLGRVLLAGAPTGDVTGWAGHRLVDTILGCGIALVATYLLWPRDRETEETVPVPAT